MTPDTREWHAPPFGPVARAWHRPLPRIFGGFTMSVATAGDWTKSTVFTLDLQDDRSYRKTPRNGYVSGNIGIHRDADHFAEDKWKLTHHPSGLFVGARKTKRDACAVIAELREKFDLAFLDKMASLDEAPMTQEDWDNWNVVRQVFRGY
jgi:hypothetical protein